MISFTMNSSNMLVQWISVPHQLLTNSTIHFSLLMPFKMFPKAQLMRQPIKPKHYATDKRLNYTFYTYQTPQTLHWAFGFSTVECVSMWIRNELLVLHTRAHMSHTSANAISWSTLTWYAKNAFEINLKSNGKGKCRTPFSARGVDPYM